ncbi:MAG TPA: phosphatase PAP2 family protein [Rhizomicrobium sp.]|nr:phosphatase PAP2 family protein [Rhizomicrobium sp.]
MKNRSILIIAFLLAGLMPAMPQTLVQPTSQTQTPVAARPPRPPARLIYLSADFLPLPGLLLPAPAKPDSAEGRDDLAAVKAAQAGASPERIALAAADDKNETVWFLANILPGFEASRLPVTDKLFKAARNDENFEVNAFKRYFARERPFDIDHSIKTCVPSVYGRGLESYPSGHATMGYSLSIILAHLIPEKAETILARAKEYGANRVICGVHFPSDIAASQALGTAVALELMSTPAFKADLDAAKAELIGAGLTKP